ncbi:MAG: SAM-dependent methyltransferase [Paracoccus sp. (in: a-proteobacteria)]|nr:SAM-dependent methyltransferase [Paracoccus sp. (in: a-proteobacteria)]
MSRLKDLIAAQIRASGPIGIAEYMELCLLHPEHGYYTTREVFGGAGDFVTAPEISQMFGELLGLVLAQAWLDQGRPQGAVIAELGPGRGTLMSDARRAMAAAGAAALPLYLIEASPRLREVQKAAHPDARHIDHAADLPDAPVFLIANEFFDALPIRQFQRVPDGWAERLIGLEGGALRFGLGPVMAGGPDAPEGTIREYCPAAASIIAQIVGRIAARGGAAIIVDYGGWDGQGDTFQAMRAHGYADPLQDPGRADLTAHVDFAALARAAREAGAETGYTTQGNLLRALGIEARAQRLAAKDAGALGALSRLTGGAQMGDLFKVLGLWPKGAPALPGFENAKADIA